MLDPLGVSIKHVTSMVFLSHIFSIYVVYQLKIEIPSTTIDIPGMSHQNLVYRIEIPCISLTGAICLL